MLKLETREETQEKRKVYVDVYVYVLLTPKRKNE